MKRKGQKTKTKNKTKQNKTTQKKTKNKKKTVSSALMGLKPWISCKLNE